MSKQPTAALPYLLPLDHKLEEPLYLQLYHALREAILNGQLSRGTQLPPTRVLASELAVSRTTVVTAFEQLFAEGYLEARVGSGTFVASALPEEMLHVHAEKAPLPEKEKHPQLSQRSQRVMHSPLVPRVQSPPAKAFQPGLPALDAFPFDVWSRLAVRHYQHPPFELLSYGDPAGYCPLRDAIARYLTASRAVRCQPEQVLIFSGAQQALDITARILLEEGDVVWMENPGYPRARGILLASGARVVSVPLDQEGLNIEAGKRLGENARMAYVTPSHQYPMGITMSLPRRLALLDWAQRAGAWILEDDYDSEFRYRGRPLASLQGLDKHGQVIYMGSFSKVLFPALRLGYLVLPPELVEPFIALRALYGRYAPTVEQAIVTDFITEGHFLRHIRRMRALYAHRQQILVEAVQQELHGVLELEEHDAGMHLIGWLPQTMDDHLVSQRIAEQGIDAQALSAYSEQKPERPGLILGYAGVNDQEIRDGVRQIANVIESLSKKHNR
ncbi:MAG TPA: PLP-dependent aminotransferase family protein [Ktedonobacteraceae bacterium]|nr:PLP-dependent aminotransferase family protein [Ktedonobacteraceae bacterium]